VFCRLVLVVLPLAERPRLRQKYEHGISIIEKRQFLVFGAPRESTLKRSFTVLVYDLISMGMAIRRTCS